MSSVCPTPMSWSTEQCVAGTGAPRRPSVALQKAPGSILGEEKAPLLIDEDRAKKLQALSEMIGRKMAQKFKTVRQCFHFIDVEHKGSIVREDIHRLFRNLHLDQSFGHTDLSYADDFYDLLNLDGNHEIDFHELQAFIGPYVHPGCPILVSSSDPDPEAFDDRLKRWKFFPPAPQEEVKDMYKTTYAGSLSARTTPRPPTGLMPGYGGFVPNWNHDVLAGLRAMDLKEESLDPLPRNGRRKSESDVRASTEPILSSMHTPRDMNTPVSMKMHTPRDAINTPVSMHMTPSGLPPLKQDNMVRRLNHAAMTAGSGFFSGRALQRRSSR